MTRTLYPSLFAPPKNAPFPETVTEDRWHQPWSEPVRAKPRDAWFQDVAFPPQQGAAVAPSFGYFGPFSNPVQTKPSLNASLQQFLAYSESAQFPETVMESKFHQPWSEPVRTKPRDAYFQDFIDTFFLTGSPAFGYYLPLAEPVRQKPGLNAALQQFQPYEETAQFPEGTLLPKWFEALSEPVRVKPAVRTGDNQDLFWNSLTPSPAFSTFWLTPFSEPVRQKPGLSPSLQQFLAFVKGSPFPEAVFESKWHEPWSEPVRLKPGLNPGLQHFLEWYPKIIINTASFTLNTTEVNGDLLAFAFFAQAVVSSTPTSAAVSLTEIGSGQSPTGVIEK